MSNNTRAAKIPVIPPVPSDASPALRKTLEAIKQAIEVMAGTRGNELDKVVSKRDLESLGLNTKIMDTPVTYDFSDNVVNSNGPVPNPPRGLEILQRVVANKLTWEDPADGKFTHIEVWASKDSQSFSDAELVGYVNKGIEEFEHGYVNVRSDYYYWIRSVNSYGKYSIWHPTFVQGGMLAPAIVDETINDLLAQLMDDDKYQTIHKIVADSFQVIQPTEGLEEGKKVFVVGQIDGGPAVGIAADMFVDGAVVARMIDANVVTAEHVGTNELIANSVNIKDGVITNAHIKDYIRSNNYSSGSTGWNINKNGSAEFNNVTIRTTLQSTNYALGTSGWKIEKTGNAEFNNATFRGTIAAANINTANLNVIGEFNLAQIPEITIQAYDGSPSLSLTMSTGARDLAVFTGSTSRTYLAGYPINAKIELSFTHDILAGNFHYRFRVRIGSISFYTAYQYYSVSNTGYGTLNGSYVYIPSSNVTGRMYVDLYIVDDATSGGRITGSSGYVHISQVQK